MKNKKLKTLTFGISLLLLSACGNNGAEPVVSVPPEQAGVEEHVIEEPVRKEPDTVSEGKEEAEEIVEEVAEKTEKTGLSYIEENGLEFCGRTSLTIAGVRMNPNDASDYEVIDSDWRITGITVEEKEDGGRTITVEQKATGYTWTSSDWKEARTNIIMPGGLFCDIYTGKIISASTGMYGGYPVRNITTEIEWDGETYDVTRSQLAEWGYGEWNPDGEGGNILPCTLSLTDTLEVDEGYDGLAMILEPLTAPADLSKEAGKVEKGEENHILDFLDEDGYLFRIDDAYIELAMADVESGGNDSGEKAVAIESGNPVPDSGQASGNAAKQFDPAFYASAYPDVVSACGTDVNALYDHYQNYGRKEGRMAYAGAKGGESVSGIANTTVAAAEAEPETPQQASTVDGIVPISQLANYSSVKKNLTDAELQAAYDAALGIVQPLVGLSAEEQLTGIETSLRARFDAGMSYSTSAPHYNDPYGYLVLGTASCAGSARTTGLCLNMLGYSYEHVNENQWAHQWCRVNLGGTYWICDPYGLYAGPEPSPYGHPRIP